MENNYKNQTQKIVLNDNWEEELLKSIEYNNEKANSLDEEAKKVIIDRNERILDKLKKYRKVNENNETYYYFYQRELKDLFWILLENNVNLCK